MFDIDGTLVQSFEFDEKCYLDAVHQVLGTTLDMRWNNYRHVTDSGILKQHLDTLGLSVDYDNILHKVKTVFIANIANHINKYPVIETQGAAKLLSMLRKSPNINLAIATGGWLETAELKLKSAGIDFSDIPIASSNDHYSRTEIMKFAKAKLDTNEDSNTIYFGDAEWDKNACASLGYGFVLVGNRISNKLSILNFSDHDNVFNIINSFTVF